MSCCTRILDIGCFPICQENIEVPITALQTGQHEVRYDNGQGAIISCFKSFDEGENFTLDPQYIRAYKNTTISIFNPDKTRLILNSKDVEFDCFSLRKNIKKVVIDEPPLLAR